MTVIKNGTVKDSSTINTGLSSVQLFVIYRTFVGSTGLVNGCWHNTLGTHYTYCGTKSDVMQGFVCASTPAPTVSGGNVTWKGTGLQGLASGVQYTWIAYGIE